jgi:hypothetical protein
VYGPDIRAVALQRLAEGRSLNGVSQELGVSRAALRAWRASGGAYARGRGDCPRDDLDEHQYAYLLGLYLGDGCLSEHARGVFALRVACADAYPGLIEECRQSIEAVVPNRVSQIPSQGCSYVTAYSKHWPCLFPQHGPGRKHERPIVLERWQRELVERHPGRFVRGLIHSDGCRVINRVGRVVGGERREYAYPRYFFTNASSDILGLAEWALDLLGVQHRRTSARNLSVARRESVALLDQHVGQKS